MRVFTDYAGRRVRLTAEREDHIAEHPEMAELSDGLADVIGAPERAVRSASDPMVELLYEFRRGTKVDDKWLCVVIKYLTNDAFVVTAYLTDKIKQGENLWAKK